MKPGEKPSPDQIARARERAKMTQAEASALIYKQWRAWDRWEKGLRKMDPAYWELWQLKARIAQLEEARS
jgi:putative transcriptional regulator